MIYSEDFVWLHFPKCAGTKVEQLFKEYFSDKIDIFQDPVGKKNDPTVAWHDSISKRKKRDSKFQLGHRTIISSFRRLPSWLESIYNYETRRNLNNVDWPDAPQLLLKGEVFTGVKARKINADVMCKKYLPKHLLVSGRVKFIRNEFFEEDFKDIFGHYVDISRIPDWEYKKHVNKSNSWLTDNS